MPTKLTVRRPSDFVEFRKESVLQGIHERFEEQVRLYPANVAVKTSEATLTYAETNELGSTMRQGFKFLPMHCGRALGESLHNQV
jgi:hypothetical protein